MELGLYHHSQQFFYRSIFGAAPTDAVITLRLQAQQTVNIQQVVVRLWQSSVGESVISMTWDEEAKAFTAQLTMPAKGCLLWYYFIVRGEGYTVYYGNNPDQLGGEGMTYDYEPPSYQITVYDKQTRTPDWFKHAIVYQIFPDRFYRSRHGQSTLSGKQGAVIHSDWNDTPAYWKNEVGEILYYDFFGGNIAGIEEKVSYLKDLGITAIYLNPIFESASNHRYGTADYHRVDPFLGTNEEFASFCQKAKDMGIAVILDGVFSHTGADSIYFNRFHHYDSVGAYESRESPYYSWFRFTTYPDAYESWWGVSDLPNVDETDPSYMDFIIHDANSVLRYWMNQGISGWRLDVIDELPVPFLRDFYRTMKQENPQAVLIGEVWEDASNKISYGEQREYLCGHDIDSAMNYALRTIVVDFLLGHTDAARMQREWMHLVENYPAEHWYAMLNLISSHDIERIMTVMTPQEELDTAAAVGKKRVKLLTVWQMTMPGAPCIYYGDEVGLVGEKDPDNRRTYPWGHEDTDLLAWTKKCTALRHRHDALQTGRCIPVYAKDTVFAYIRSIEGGKDVFGKDGADGRFLIAMNTSTMTTETVTIHTDGLLYGTLTAVLDTAQPAVPTIDGTVTLMLPPLTIGVWQCAESKTKRAGILLHPTSLPSPYGNGTLGQEAYQYIDFLKTAGQSLWQILPLTPPLLGDSPYLSRSAFAGNERLISMDVLQEWGWLSADELAAFHQKAKQAATKDQQWQCKKEALWKLSHHKNLRIPWNPYEAFCKENAYWLDDYAVFRAVSDFFQGLPWTQWPEPIRRHTKQGLAYYRKELAGTISHYTFLQYIWYRQWQAVHAYAKKNGIAVLGDMPMFVAHNSADCWAHQELFQLDDAGNPTAVAGVPPDYFCEDGQLWGNPLYDYEAMKQTGYAWWIERMRHMMRLVDEIRIDHFRGFASYWSVPADAKTAKTGQWIQGPGKELFQSVYQALGHVPLVAEDLGLITDDVYALKDSLQLPGMKVLHFHMKERNDGRYTLDTEPNCLAYTGTHDNNTSRGWYEEELTPMEQAQLRQTLHLSDNAKSQDVVKALVAYVYSRQAETVIIPMQDALALPSSCRMNTPGTPTGNWQWQLEEDMLRFDTAKWLSQLCRMYHR